MEELNFLAIELLGVDGLHTPNIDHIPDDTNLWVLLNSDNGDDQGVFNARAAARQSESGEWLDLCVACVSSVCPPVCLCLCAVAGVLNAKGASPGAG